LTWLLTVGVEPSAGSGFNGAMTSSGKSAFTAPALVRVLQGETLGRPPVWFMRQAGRFLPEYRALRETTPDFISFCLDPVKAAEATLQPMRRFPFDAAIVFADILLVPRALGQEVWFEAGEGPRLGALPAVETLSARVADVAKVLSPVGETLSMVRAKLEQSRALIGFAGGPWTVFTYMMEGGSTERVRPRALAYSEPERIDRYLEVLVEASAFYLAMQVQAGAQALQIFESWAEGLAEPLFERLVIRPHKALIGRLRELGVTVPIIGFPRGCGALADRYAQEVPSNAVGLGTETPLAQGLSIQKHRTIQGALDPLLLRAGGPALLARTEALMGAWGEGPYVFNLGHGILPDTPIPHVEAVLSLITYGKAAA